MRRLCPDLEWPEFAERDLATAWARYATNLRDFAAVGASFVMSETLGADLVRRLDEWAPAKITLPGGRKLTVSYPEGQSPWVESRLQDFFGMKQVPRIAQGRDAIVLHLLAPNGRDVQVTSDLAGFWDRHYPGIAAELRRRYPRHSWPDDPSTARPPEPRPPRRRG